MIERVIDYCIQNRFVVLLFTALLIVWGIVAVRSMPLDAIPDLSDNQVIVFTEWPGQGPKVIQDQITYPLSSKLQGLPKLKAVRAQSFFGFSLIYVIFKDDVDIYWARSRVLEKLSEARAILPPEVTPTLGPDGTGVGHVFWYVLESDGSHDLAQLRSLQDWYIRWQLTEVDGVAEVASIGGFVKQYQIDLDPNKLAAQKIPLKMVVDAVKRSNRDVGGRLLEHADTEYFVRGLGYFQSPKDIEDVAVTVRNGIPIRVRDLGVVQLGSEIRRGMLDQNGEGEVVGGIIVMRYGENAKRVIDRVKEKIEFVERGLPEGVTIRAAYDRSDLIMKSVDNLTHTLWKEGLIVALVILVFLLHLRSALVVIITLPIAVLISFIFMYHLGISSNIMSLGGIAIAIGVLVDSGIVMVENAYRHLSEGPPGAKQNHIETIGVASRQVGRGIFFSMLIIILSFLPVFLLAGQEGKLFHPLAYTKSFAMLGSAFLAITLVPVLMTLFLWEMPVGRKNWWHALWPVLLVPVIALLPQILPEFAQFMQDHNLAPYYNIAIWALPLAGVVMLLERLFPESKNPLSVILGWIYRPFIWFSLRFRLVAVLLSIWAVMYTIPIMQSIGSEFMPYLDEGSFLYMPVMLPNVTMTEAKRVLTLQDRIIKSVPEVSYVLGKVGRADTATDPAPVSMIETIILLKPKEAWRAGMTKDDLLAEMDQKLQIQGVTNGWTQPIINRINMLATGVRTDLGVKFFGPDLVVLAGLAEEAEELLKDVDGAADVFSEKVVGGKFVDIDINRDRVARYGLTTGDVQDLIMTGIGGMPITQTVEGLERFPVRVRFMREYRDNIEGLRMLRIATPTGAQVTLGELATLTYVNGPPMINSENGLPRSAVLLNVRGRDMGSFVDAADLVLKEGLTLPAGYSYAWSGQYENQIRAKERLSIVIPIVLLVIFILLYFTFHNLLEAMTVMLSVPFALIGGVLYQNYLGYNFSVAVWVGYLALFGVAVETGVVMLIYLNEALDERLKKGWVTLRDIYEAAFAGSALRLRPKVMTVATTLLGLAPIMASTGVGADVMKPIAAPLIGGIITSAIHVLLVTPVVFSLHKEMEARLGILHASGAAHGGDSTGLPTGKLRLRPENWQPEEEVAVKEVDLD